MYGMVWHDTAQNSLSGAHQHWFTDPSLHYTHYSIFKFHFMWFLFIHAFAHPSFVVHLSRCFWLVYYRCCWCCGACYFPYFSFNIIYVLVSFFAGAVDVLNEANVMRQTINSVLKRKCEKYFAPPHTDLKNILRLQILSNGSDIASS